MRISYNWLKDFVDFSHSPEELSQLLTFLGLETKVVEQSGAWKNVVTAKVIEAAKHPNADKLRLCAVTDGTATFQVVCGAPNVAAGQTVALARIEAELPGGIKIKRAKIRGVESEGMICSEKELGISDESAGIMVLPDNTPLGTPLAAVLGEADAILEVEITTNRPDCLSHLGVAREIGAKLNKPVKLPEIREQKAPYTVRITVNNGDLCPRYIGTLITGITVGPSPAWIVQRLKKCGLRSINNIVDITNYVLMELGHPLHAFDLAAMSGGEVVVRTAKSGEKIVALDGREYALKDSMLIIADAAKPQAIAGVMGGEHSGVTTTTTAIILESAQFAAAGIRRTSKMLNISTDASYRFERGTGWDVAELASNRAAELIVQIAGGKIEARTDKVEKPYVPIEIELRPERVQHILSVAFSNDEIECMLNALGADVRRKDGKFRAIIPSWRLDLKQEIDLIEELARLKGYENIPVTVMPINPGMEAARESRAAEDIIRERLKGLGFSEAVNYSFAEDAIVKKFGVSAAFRIANPLSKENEVLRPDMLSGLWKNLNSNMSQGCEDIRLFESGTVFPQDGEHNALGLMVLGAVWSDWWGWEQLGSVLPKYDFNFLNGVVQYMFAGNRLAVRENKAPSPCYHPGKTAILLIGGKEVGQFGILRPGLAPDAASEIGYAEFNLSLIEDLWNRQVPRYVPLRRFPPVKRDISLLAGKDVPFDRISGVMAGFIGTESLLQEFELFSRYEDVAKLGPDTVSYSLHLFFRHSEHTLTDAEVNEQIDRILGCLNKELGVTLRA